MQLGVIRISSSDLLTGNTSTTGNFTGQIAMEYFNVWPEARLSGIGGFHGIGDKCNFEAVFRGFAALLMIPFSFSSERIATNRLNFANLEAARKNRVKFGAAKLYVHRRDKSDLTSSAEGIGVLLEGVTVVVADRAPKYQVILMGTSANLVNP